MARLKLNLDEQKKLLLNFLNETNNFFSFKELEKNVSNLKGLQSHNLKVILKALVEEGFVKEEKIDKIDCYWTINVEVSENKELINLKNKILEENNKLIDLELEIKKFDDEKQILFNEKISSEKNVNIENSLNEKNEELQEEENLKKKKELIEKVNLWTENIFLIKKFVKNKFNLEEKALNKGFGIPNDLDFL